MTDNIELKYNTNKDTVDVLIETADGLELKTVNKQDIDEFIKNASRIVLDLKHNRIVKILK